MATEKISSGCLIDNHATVNPLPIHLRMKLGRLQPLQFYLENSRILDQIQNFYPKIGENQQRLSPLPSPVAQSPDGEIPVLETVHQLDGFRRSKPSITRSFNRNSHTSNGIVWDTTICRSQRTCTRSTSTRHLSSADSSISTTCPKQPPRHLNASSDHACKGIPTIRTQHDFKEGPNTSVHRSKRLNGEPLRFGGSSVNR